MKLIETIAHFFIPRQSNNYRAKLLHHDVLAVYVVAAVILSMAVGRFQTQHGSILGYATDISPQKLYELTNKEREKAGLTDLVRNEKLDAAASAKAKDMFQNNYWAHYSPTGKTPWEFILGSGYQYEYAGENLAKNFLFSQGVVDAWMASTTHRENILRKEYADVGYAVVNGILNGEETTLVVQEFGTPYYADSADSSQVQNSFAPRNDTNQESQKAVAPPPAPAEPFTGDALHFNNSLNPQATFDSSQSQPLMTRVLQMNYLFFGMLLLVLCVDFYVAVKLNIIHIRNSHIIHILFLGFILAGLYIIAKGSII